MASTLEKENESKDKDYVLAKSLGGGPLGIGDPNDRSLRKAESEIMIPQKMKLKAKTERCAEEVKKFGECAKEKGLMMPFLCRAVAKEMGNCLSAAYSDPSFVDQCTKEYLDERSEYRRTGVKAKAKKKEAVM
ncbi:unnamed protein product [Lymnaea stagnalis]|uniref:COX assembly mitochondrial protein n=1 Tax=Lymnaea stagnalis TaxID=6523 RepID=A0AAV2IL98_LYMST